MVEVICALEIYPLESELQILWVLFAFDFGFSGFQFFFVFFLVFLFCFIGLDNRRQSTIWFQYFQTHKILADYFMISDIL